MVLEIYGLLGS
jgi:glutathione S-transferase